MNQLFKMLWEPIRKHFEHLPAELAVEFARRHREHKAEEAGAGVTHEQALETLSSLLLKPRLRTFLEAIGSRRYDEALSCCAPDLQRVLEQEGVAAKFDTLRAHLTDVIEFGSTTSTFSETGWHLTGVITYTRDRKANFNLDFKTHSGGWKIAGYKFDAVPLPPPAESPASRPDESRTNTGSGKAWVSPVDGYKCPDGYPVKGSARYVYHVPGGRFYERTRPIRCFATTAEAEAAGFLASQR